MIESQITDEILEKLPSPCWLLEERALERNLVILKNIKEQTGVKILLALKGYSLWSSFDMVSRYLDGCCASGLHEAILGSEKFGKELHTYSPAFAHKDIEQIATLSHHIVFNSIAQLEKYHSIVKNINPDISIGIRVNPEISSSPVEMYNPCGLYSRFGITIEKLSERFETVGEYIDGFHFHALCEQDSDALESVLEAFEEKFGRYLHKLKWVNFGGGHHITRDGYDIDRLISLLNGFGERYPHLQIYLEPGEAVGWQTGTLVATVLDIVHNGMDIAILDTSAEAHMPDTIIMPYRADIRGAKEPHALPHTYRLTANTCLSGDIMGDYSFKEPLNIGDRVIFEDQMHYTMVKSTTFNGIPLPSIAILRKSGELEIIKEFGYEDFLGRLS